MNALHRIFKLLINLSIGVLVAISLALPLPYRKKLLRLTAPWSYPLMTRLLFPAIERETQRTPSWAAPVNPKAPSTDLVLAFGGNDETQRELLELLNGALLFRSKIFNSKQKTIPVLLIPLFKAYSEAEYLEIAMKNLLTALTSCNCDTIQRLHIIGHSLGGAIALQLSIKILELFPHAQVFLTLDRTFCTLRAAAKSQFSLGGWVLEHTLGYLWSFDSTKALLSLTPIERLHVDVIQVLPDHILGSALLSETIRHAPRRDWHIYILDRPRSNRLHATSFLSLQIPSLMGK